MHQVKQPEDRYTLELPHLEHETGNGGGRMRSLSELVRQRDSLDRSLKQQGKKRGAYAGAVKLGSPNHAARARTGLSQAEFAKRAGISERTLRTWEAGEPVSLASANACLAVLREYCIEPMRRQPVKYRDAETGNTWSGRGLMPAWMRHRLANGKRLADFEASR